MHTCPACAATSPNGATWCSQCYAPLSATTPAAEPAFAAAGAVSFDRFGLAAAAPANAFGLPGAPAPPPVPATGLTSERAAPMLSGRALALVATAIGIGVVATAVSWALGHNDRLEPATYLRYVIVLTLGVYAVVGGLIITKLVPGVSLRWHHGNPARSIVVGALVGGALGGGMLWLVSTASHHLASDQRIVTLMSEGDVAHILVSIGITVVCAPLVEETLFRGLLLESMRAKSAAAGLLTSAVCFALWHLNIAVIPLVYYSLMGLMLGKLYMKRGLACSMAGHAAFNGVLTVAALAIVLAPARTVVSGDISLRVPGGWTQHDVGYNGVGFAGPSGSALLVFQTPAESAPTATAIVQRLQQGLLNVPQVNLAGDTASVRQTQIPAGSAVEIDFTADGHSGVAVFVPRPSEVVEVVFLSGGSMKAKADFPHMLDSLRVG